MSYQPFTIKSFGGLNLNDDPEAVGAEAAVDVLNVDLDSRGQLRSRDGFDNFTSSAAASRLSDIRAVQFTSGTRQVLAASPNGASSFWRAYSSAGATVASQTVPLGILGLYDTDFTRFGGPAAEVVYTSGRDTDPLTGPGAGVPVYKWDGAAWAAAPGVALGVGGPFMLEVQSPDNRLVGVFPEAKYSRVGFSDAGVPETWGVNNYVDLTPGDGERITALVAWRELVFVFKETKFFVFTGNSTSGTGTPTFNYRPVNTGVGVVGRSCAVASPSGVYFLSRRGIYKTTGGDPVLVSRSIDPIFRGGVSPFFSGGTLNTDYIVRCQLVWHDERLFFAYPSGSSTTNDKMLVFDPEIDQWLLWDVAANGISTYNTGDEAQLLFSYAAGTNHIGKLSRSYTTDDGVAITSRYQSGFFDLGPSGADAYTRWTRLWGSGAPTVSVFTDYGSSDSLAAAVTLGTSPAIAEGYHIASYKGRLFSHKLSASSTWQIARLQHDVSWVRP